MGKIRDPEKLIQDLGSATLVMLLLPEFHINYRKDLQTEMFSVSYVKKEDCLHTDTG